VPPEPIAGFITIGRGVSIHRATCANLIRLREAQPQRVLAVDWGRPSADRTFAVAIEIDAFDRRGLVRDISSVLADERISIETMHTATNAAENTAKVDLTVSVHGFEELSRLLSRIAGLPNVISARRRR
jgi:GTP pyrophosphokinase